MRPRLLALVLLVACLLAFHPAWMVVDRADPLAWFGRARPEDAAAAAVRLVALALGVTQLLALTLAGVAASTRRELLQRIAHRLLLPVLRGTAPLALVAGTSLPAIASEAHLPVRLADPSIERTMDAVEVQRGDSLWTIAAAHTAGPIGPYWIRLIDLNRDRFEDVNLIHPGDEVLLPAD